MPDTTTPVAAWTPTRVFDYAQETLGVGTFNGEPNEFPAWRMQQIGVLKRIMTRRRIPPAQVVQCVDYCKAHRIQPENHAALIYHIEDAIRWKRTAAINTVDEDIEAALRVEQERAFSDQEATRWIDMLLRATGPTRREVLDLWQKTRSPK